MFQRENLCRRTGNCCCFQPGTLDNQNKRLEVQPRFTFFSLFSLLPVIVCTVDECSLTQSKELREGRREEEGGGEVVRPFLIPCSTLAEQFSPFYEWQLSRVFSSCNLI